MAKQSNTELAVVPAAEYALARMDAARVSELVRENTGGKGLTAFDLDRVSMPTGGGTMWSVPSLDGTENVAELIGVVPYFADTRSYWQTSFDAGSGGPPDCTSSDLVTGVGRPGGTCAKCPHAQFGSKVKGDGYGAGQACSENRTIFLMRATDRMPLVVKLAPTSVKECRRFCLRLINNDIDPREAVWGISLVQDKSADGIKYAKASFRMVERLTAEMAAKVREFATALKPSMERAAQEVAASNE